MGKNSLRKFELGEVVHCSGYLKKKKVKYVLANDDQVAKYIEKNGYEPPCYTTIEKDGNDDYLEQQTREVVSCDFVGVVIGIKDVSTVNCYHQAERSFFDGDGYCVSSDLIDEVRVTKESNVYCLHVAYAINKTRLVPIENVTRVEDDNTSS